jgi:hypothetical protein
MLIEGIDLAEGKIALNLLSGPGSGFQVDTALYYIAEQAGGIGFLQ